MPRESDKIPATVVIPDSACCPECGEGVPIDEDGCCAGCGRDAWPVPTAYARVLKALAERDAQVGALTWALRNAHAFACQKQVESERAGFDWEVWRHMASELETALSSPPIAAFARLLEAVRKIVATRDVIERRTQLARDMAREVRISGIPGGVRRLEAEAPIAAFARLLEIVWDLGDLVEELWVAARAAGLGGKP